MRTVDISVFHTSMVPVTYFKMFSASSVQVQCLSNENIGLMKQRPEYW